MIHYLLDLLRSEGFFEAWVLTNKSNSAAMMLYSSTGGIKDSDDEQMFVYYL